MVSAGFIAPSSRQASCAALDASVGRLPFFFFRHERAHFKDRDQRQVADEQEEQEQEKSDRSKKSKQVPPRRVVHTPSRWKKIAMQAGDDDDEPLEPHTHVDNHGDRK